MAQGPHSADLTATADPKPPKPPVPWVASALHVLGGIGGLIALIMIAGGIAEGKADLLAYGVSALLGGLLLIAAAEALKILASIEHRLYQRPPT